MTKILAVPFWPSLLETYEVCLWCELLATSPWSDSQAITKLPVSVKRKILLQPPTEASLDGSFRELCYDTVREEKGTSGNRKWWRQTGSRQSTPLSTIRTRYGNSVSTPEYRQTCKTQQKCLQKGSRYGISVSTPHRRYGHRLRTPFLRTPFPRLLEPKPKLFGPGVFGWGGDLLHEGLGPKSSACPSILVTCAHWTGSPNKSIDQIGKNCPRKARKLCFQLLWTTFGQFSDIFFDVFRTFFRDFSDILSTFPFSGLSNGLPVTIRYPGKPNFLAGYPGIFARMSRRCPKTLRKKFVFNSGPLFRTSIICKLLCAKETFFTRTPGKESTFFPGIFDVTKRHQIYEGNSQIIILVMLCCRDVFNICSSLPSVFSSLVSRGYEVRTGGPPKGLANIGVRRMSPQCRLHCSLRDRRKGSEISPNVTSTSSPPSSDLHPLLGALCG